MKRSREEEIMFGAFQRAGCEVTGVIGKAIADGLRQIRRERYEEFAAKKEAYRQQKRNYYHMQRRKAAKHRTAHENAE